jgi:ectoine hydroxylase-related dioxygenase (phytanoyl-CoA dioxygenase family)
MTLGFNFEPGMRPPLYGLVCARPVHAATCGHCIPKSWKTGFPECENGGKIAFRKPSSSGTIPAMPELRSNVDENGFAIVSACLDEQTVKAFREHLRDADYAQRNLLSLPAIRELAASSPVRQLVADVLGRRCFATRGILFNKTEQSNWKVVWHQDLTIAVRERRETDGFGPWSVKASVVHVQPPPDIMGRILAIRLHLDESGPDNGPLRVLPASHSRGRLSTSEIANYPKTDAVTCTVPCGGALLMRPLLLHASSACAVPKPRRVIHLEFAAEELPNGLEWHDRI